MSRTRWPQPGEADGQRVKSAFPYETQIGFLLPVRDAKPLCLPLEAKIEAEKSICISNGKPL